MPADLRLSYSKLELYDRCPRAYYLQYVLSLPPKQNFYSAYGTLMHDIIRQRIEGALPEGEAHLQFARRFEAEVTPHAQDDELSNKWWFSGDEALSRPPLPEDAKEVLEVEEKRVTDLFGVDFSSIIDVLYRDTSGRLILMDHKSAARSSFYGKQGQKKCRQLYIYSAVVKQVYGVFPDLLVFNLFREGKRVEYPFSLSEYQETMTWAQDIVDDIRYLTKHAESESDWAAVTSPRFFCNTLCDVADSCGEHLF